MTDFQAVRETELGSRRTEKQDPCQRVPEHEFAGFGATCVSDNNTGYREGERGAIGYMEIGSIEICLGQDSREEKSGLTEVWLCTSVDQRRIRK